MAAPTTALRRAATWHAPLTVLVAASALCGLVCAAGLALDDRVLLGAPIWLKPLKFSVSFVVYGATLAWLLQLLPRWRRTGWWAGTVIAVAAVAEMVVIVGQVVRGRASHFNNATDLDAALFSAMGITIVVLWLATLLVAVLLVLSDLGDPATAWAVRLGAGVALLGMAVAFLMVVPTDAQLAAEEAGGSALLGAHAVGVADGGPGLPLLGWSTTGGDLRVPHFIGMHALQALPLLALALSALAGGRLSGGQRLHLVLAAAAGYAAAVVLLTWQALRGQPLLSPDAATGSAWAVLLVLVAAAAVVVVRGPRPVRGPRLVPARR